MVLLHVLAAILYAHMLTCTLIPPNSLQAYFSKALLVSALSVNDSTYLLPNLVLKGI